MTALTLRVFSAQTFSTLSGPAPRPTATSRSLSTVMSSQCSCCSWPLLKTHRFISTTTQCERNLTRAALNLTYSQSGWWMFVTPTSRQPMAILRFHLFRPSNMRRPNFRKHQAKNLSIPNQFSARESKMSRLSICSLACPTPFGRTIRIITTRKASNRVSWSSKTGSG